MSFGQGNPGDTHPAFFRRRRKPRNALEVEDRKMIAGGGESVGRRWIRRGTSAEMGDIPGPHRVVRKSWSGQSPKLAICVISLTGRTDWAAFLTAIR